jgi:ABC-type transport system substrate-binding protein
MTTPAALALLAASGYQIESNASVSPNSTPPVPNSTTPVSTGPPEVIRGRISKDGQQLSLVIGVATNDPTSVAVANTAADQLRNVGIATTVRALDPVSLYRDALDNNQVDAVVGWHQAGGNLATLLASRYGCPALQSTAISTSGAPSNAPSNSPQPTPAGTPPPAGPGTTATPTPSNRPPEPGALVQAPSNLTGICDRSIQSNIDAALNGAKNISDVITAVEPRLWNMSTVLPILQDTTIVAAGPSVQNVSLSGAVPVGIVGDAGQWMKTGP